MPKPMPHAEADVMAQQKLLASFVYGMPPHHKTQVQSYKAEQRVDCILLLTCSNFLFKTCRHGRGGMPALLALAQHQNVCNHF
eukprot:6425933-Amphidinium_carterae.1